MVRTWTFGRKLGGGFALVAGLALLMAALALFSLSAVVNSKDRVIDGAAQDLI